MEPQAQVEVRSHGWSRMLALAWDGGVEALFAWRDAAASGEPPAFVAAGSVAPFVLEAQAALLGVQLGAGAPSVAPPASAPWPQLAAGALTEGHRIVIVACGPPFSRSLVGRVLDADVLHDIVSVSPAAEATWPRTLVVSGPGFSRPLDIVVGDIAPEGDGWRIEVGLRGC